MDIGVFIGVCPECRDAVTTKYIFNYNDIQFCSLKCAATYCRENDDTCNFCDEPLCCFDSDEIVDNKYGKFCCKEHSEMFAKRIREYNRGQFERS